MNITAPHVDPEEAMAMLDRELSAEEAHAVSAHVEDCPECAKVSEQLRRTSHALSEWKVPAIPAKVEASIAELAAESGSGEEMSKPKLFIRASFWGWKQWAGLSVGAASALLFAVAALMPMKHEHSAASSRRDTFVGSSAERIVQRSESETRARAGKLQMHGGTMGGALGGIVGATSSNVKSIDAQLQVAQEQVHAPMIARTVSLSIMTKTFAASRSLLDMILARYQGYSAQLSVSTTENAPRSLQASLRIPASELSSAVSDLKALGRVERESHTGEEVTQQHTDLVARLKNSRDTEQRLRVILQQRTGKIGDVLKVEEEIARVRGEIEEMEAEQKALEHRVDFATVELELAEEYKAQLNPPAASVSTRIHNAFVAGYQNVTETLLGILLFFAEYVPALLIWVAILALPIILIWRRYRRISAAS